MRYTGTSSSRAYLSAGYCFSLKNCKIKKNTYRGYMYCILLTFETAKIKIEKKSKYKDNKLFPINHLSSNHTFVMFIFYNKMLVP